MVSFEGVEKFYGSVHVLKNIHFNVQQGEKIVLMGASGCGKSSLLRCINGLERIHKGILRVNGLDLGQLATHPQAISPETLREFRSNIGMVFQQYNLFPHLTVIENIMLGPLQVKKVSKKEAMALARHFLNEVGILEKAQQYPDQLSGGQKQRVAIARCLAMEPKMLLLDEPTSALDPPMTREVLKVIQTVVDQGMTLLMVTHEYQFAARIAHRILLLNEGQIIEEGSPQQVMENPQHPIAQEYFSKIES
ncbi:MAG: amino acid ABC transporter ATP-binding protein [Cyanobacteria bacterium]|nr:amino acid ABC transporter ATP-binding protein [Cyanobacteriota bacterium]